MLEKIIALDKQLLIFLNNLGAPAYDGFWLFITKQLNWLPLFLLVFFYILKLNGFKITFWKYFLSVLFLPIFVVLTIFFFKNYKSHSFKVKIKSVLLLVFVIAIMITFVDQMTNLAKYSFERLRPCNDLSVNQLIRVVQERSSFSFFSGHASNSMANAVFIFMILRPFYKYSFLVFIFPLVFAYSRIYLGLHFPFDILVGYLFGAFSGILFFKIFKKIKEKPVFQI